MFAGEVLYDLWYYSYAYIYGSIRTLTDIHILIDEQFYKLCPDVLSARNRERLFNDLNNVYD